MTLRRRRRARDHHARMRDAEAASVGRHASRRLHGPGEVARHLRDDSPPAKQRGDEHEQVVHESVGAAEGEAAALRTEELAPAGGAIAPMCAKAVAGSASTRRVLASYGTPRGVRPVASSLRSQKPWALSQKRRPALDQHMRGKQCHILVRCR